MRIDMNSHTRFLQSMNAATAGIGKGDRVARKDDGATGRVVLLLGMQDSRVHLRHAQRLLSVDWDFGGNTSIWSDQVDQLT